MCPRANWLRRLLENVAPVADSHGEWAAPEHITVAFFPAFENDEIAGDFVWRAIWALAPLSSRVTQLALSGVKEPKSLLHARPDYLSGEIETLVRNLPYPLAAANEHDALKADVILVWRFDAALDRRLASRRAYLVDESAFEHASDRWTRISSDAASILSPALFRHQTTSDYTPYGDRAVLVGTGPSLDAGLAQGLVRSDDDVFVCNSAVRRADLFKRYRVRAIGLGDPVFHSGPCRMAGKLREDLLARMAEDTDVLLICPKRDAAIYSALPNIDRRRIIPLKIDEAMSIASTDLRRELVAPASSNVMTLTLLPLVLGRYREIAFIGCDGQEPRKSGYFWKHSATAQYAGDFDSAYLGHPAFFRRNFEDYATQHSQTLDAWISHAETLGTKVTSLTPSHILPLAKRFKLPSYDA